MEFLLNLWETFNQWRKSRMALPYLNTAANYLETRLNRLPGDFDIEVDPGAEAIYYVYRFGDLKFNIELSTGKEQPTKDTLRRLLSTESSRDITIDLSSIVGAEHGTGLPTHLIDAMISDMKKQIKAAEAAKA